jgi:hypothetical protein
MDQAELKERFLEIVSKFGSSSTVDLFPVDPV